ncbi:MAG: hypothetical protein AAF921_04995 [Cyanobacteria bacterium P01_D01_bin.44]
MTFTFPTHKDPARPGGYTSVARLATPKWNWQPEKSPPGAALRQTDLDFQT